MPSQGNLPQSHIELATGHSDPYYSNEDVEILHNIVVFAQELLPSLPERERLPTNALFNAYYDILPRIGIDADHDSRYARILFKIGGLRGPGTLYEKFEEVLARMGIEIEFDPEAVDEESSRSGDSNAERENITTADASLLNGPRDSRSRTRRNSESSVWDATRHTPTFPRARRSSFSSVRPIKLSNDIKKRSSPSSPPAPASHTPSEYTAPTADIGEAASTRATTPLRSATQYEESIASMQVDASKTYQQAIEQFTRLQIRRWKANALHTQERNFCLEQIAIRHDRKALLHSAFDAWRSSFLEKRELARQEQHYKDLEERAQKARNIYLMDLAFSHWSAVAKEQVQRTARARKHIVHTRVLNAWKDVTQVDESQARKQVLKKFLAALKHRSTTIAQAKATAMQTYQTNLVEKIYRQWLHQILDMKATNWWAERLARRTLVHWVDRSRNVWETDRMAEERNTLQRAAAISQVWRAKTESQAQRSVEAGAIYKDNLCRSLLQKWRRDTKVVPAAKLLQTEVSTRLLRDAFGTWRTRASQERQAATVDRTKILREALTVWRHKERSQKFASRIDNRVLQQSMSSWVQASREKKLQQSLKDKLLRRVLQTWKSKQQVLTQQRQERENAAQIFAAQRSQNLVLRQWYSCMETQQRNEATAIEHYAPRLVRGSMTQWSEQLQHVRQLEQRSRDAEYFFLATKALKLWKAATESARREKRKAAYVQVRRNVKINLARRVLKTWQSKAQPIMEMQAQASSINHNKQSTLAVEIYDRWKSRAEELSELESIARQHVLKKQFTIWKERLRTQQALSREASIAYEEGQQSRVLKKWSLTTLQLRAQVNYANEIREKNSKRNFRRIFVYWHQKAVEERPPNPEWMASSVHFEAPTDIDVMAETEEEDPDGGEAGNLDEIRVPVGVPISLPGYLSTPSKRSQRLNATAARLSTTPKAPLSTPFERHLRAQWSGGGPSSFRSTHRRSTLEQSEFSDIPERSTNHDVP